MSDKTLSERMFCFKPGPDGYSVKAAPLSIEELEHVSEILTSIA